MREYIDRDAIERFQDELMEKAIPKTPHFSLFNGGFWCPNCERLIKQKVEEDSEINIRYCPFCGQALNWGDIE